MAMMESSSNTTLYETCFRESRGSEPLLLQCITLSFEEKRLEVETRHFNQSLLSWLLVICGALVFLMQAGFAMVCAGSVRKKNVVNTMLKNLLDACAAAIAFYTVGYGFAYGGEADQTKITFIGNKYFFGYGVENFGFWFFQYAFSAAVVTIVAGTLAERCKMTAYFFYSLYLTGFVYPVVVHAVWSSHGFLSAFSSDPVGGIGFVDAAGSGAIHLTGGLTALIATAILGPRQGRFHDENGNPLEEPTPIRGHSMPLQLLGTFILWFGWYGFNGGSALLLPGAKDMGLVATRAAVNTTMAGATAALTSLGYWALTTGRKGLLAWDLPHAMNGALGGLVSITSGCFTLDYWSSGITGILAGILYITGCQLLERWRIDDAVNAVPVHMFCGALGVLATGLFSNPDHIEDTFGVVDRGGIFFELGRTSGSFDAIMLRNQFYGLVFISGWTVLTTAPFFLWLNWMKWFRVDRMVEIGGLDAAYHAEDMDKLAEAELRAAMFLDSSKHKKNYVNNERPEPSASATGSSHRPKVVTFA